MFCTSTHMLVEEEQRAGVAIGKPIMVNDGAWIGARVVIAPGIIIGKGAIVAIGSVVTKNVPDNELWGGNPAKFIRQLD